MRQVSSVQATGQGVGGDGGGGRAISEHGHRDQKKDLAQESGVIWQCRRWVLGSRVWWSGGVV